MSGTADVVVVGAGVLGCSTALELARAGHRVQVVDAGASPGAGSTSASSAIVRFTYSTWTGVVASWESRAAWLDWAGHLGAAVDVDGVARFVRTGGLVLDPPGAPRPVLPLLVRAGVPHEEWDAGDLRRHLPQLDPARCGPPRAVDDDAFWSEPDGEVSGTWVPDSGHVDDPQRAAQDLAAAAQRNGAAFRWRALVVGVETAGGRVSGVRLADGARLSAPVVVNAAGPHSARVDALAGVRADWTVGTRALRQEVHVVDAPEGWGTGPFVADLDLGVYLRSAPGGLLLVGGLEADCDPLEWVDDPDDWPVAPTQALHRTYLYRAARRLPGLRVPERTRGTAGLYDVTDDWVPVYDRTALDGWYVAVGTSGNQFKNAPVVGRFLAALVDACESGHDHDADPVQVPLPRTGHVADLGHYSRRRPVHADSSFTVMG